MATSTLDSILGFVIPLFVVMFLIWILYKIPIIESGVNALIRKLGELKDRRDNSSTGTTRIQSIQYE